MQAHQKNILIIDDDREFVEALAFDLAEHGFNIFKAYDGMTAQQILTSQPMDLILCDERMPNGDGESVLTAVKKRNPLYPNLIFISGHCAIPTAEAYHKGAAAAIAKPLSPQTLITLVNRYAVGGSEKWLQEPVFERQRPVSHIPIGGDN